jgi:hypothetical protein
MNFFFGARVMCSLFLLPEECLFLPGRVADHGIPPQSHHVLRELLRRLFSLLDAEAFY